MWLLIWRNCIIKNSWYVTLTAVIEVRYKTLSHTRNRIYVYRTDYSSLLPSIMVEDYMIRTWNLGVAKVKILSIEPCDCAPCWALAFSVRAHEKRWPNLLRLCAEGHSMTRDTISFWAPVLFFISPDGYPAWWFDGEDATHADVFVNGWIPCR